MNNTWNLYYVLAKKYYEEHGDLSIKHAYTVEFRGRTYELGMWLKKQKELYSKNLLNEEQVLLLDEIGFRLDVKGNLLKNYLLDNKELNEEEKDYIKEVYSYPSYSVDERIELFDKYKNGDSKAFDMLLKSFLKDVIAVANKYVNKGYSLFDLIGYGNEKLIKYLKNINKMTPYSMGLFNQHLGLYYDTLISKKSKGINEYEISYVDDSINKMDSKIYMDDFILKIKECLTQYEFDIFRYDIGLGCEHKTDKEISELTGCSKNYLYIKKMIIYKKVRRYIKQDKYGNIVFKNNLRKGI